MLRTLGLVALVAMPLVGTPQPPHHRRPCLLCRLPRRRLASSGTARRFSLARSRCCRLEPSSRKAGCGAARDPGTRPERTSRRVLARCRSEQRMARRHGRKLGARPVLSGRPAAARLPAARRRPHREGEAVGRVDADAPAGDRRARAGRRNTDWWPNMVMLKVLTQYQEATGDPRVVPALTKYFTYHLSEAGRRPAASSGPSIAGPTSC